MKLVSGGRSTSDCVKLLVFGLISSSIELLFSTLLPAGEFSMTPGIGLNSSPIELLVSGWKLSRCDRLAFGASNLSIELLFSATLIAGFAMLRSFGDSNSPIELLFSDWCTSRKFSEEPVWFSNSIFTPKISPQNDVVGGLKKPPYLCTTSGKKKHIDNIRPPYEFLGGVSTPKIHPKIT